MSSKIIFVFLDGVGLGMPDEHNPFWVAPMPYISDLIGSRLCNTIHIDRPGLLLKGIDACLGVEGLPQSATGQTALLTGINAAKVIGYHLTAYPNDQLIRILHTHNILTQAIEKGFKTTFANAYDLRGYQQLIDKGAIAHSATTQSVLGAHLPFRSIEDLQEGNAVYWDITNTVLIEHRNVDIQRINPETAGQRLINLTNDYNLVLFESFMTDLLGHRRNFDNAVSFVEILDSFLNGILHNMSTDTTLVVSSDHGNIEDMSTGSHTYNPVPLLVVGPKAPLFAKAQSITDLSDSIMKSLAC